ncbi:MAG: isoprenylcysteine carboxylmethyltransferase family protein [Pseudomonadota bacterium]
MRLDLPPVWLVLFMALAWASSGGGANPSGAWDTALLWPGRALVLLGILLAIWSAIAFRAARTTIIPKERPSALVETGPYQYSRNPIYVADLMILAGWCLTLGAPLALILLAPFWWVLQTRFILPEEEILTEDLGEPYLDYKSRVRRWL